MTELRTFADWETLFYQRQLSKIGVKNMRLVDLLYKADDPVTTSTTGVYTTLYGAQVYDNLYKEAPLWGMLPKTEWANSGIRVITANATTCAGITSTGALVEPDHPDISIYTLTPKRMNYTFDVTEIAEKYSQIQDGPAGGEVAFQMKYAMDYFTDTIDDKLSYDSGTTANAAIESLDRVTASTSEDTLCTDAAGNAFDANDNDWYTFDRDSTSTYDAYALSGTTHNSGTDRPLTLSLIDACIAGAGAYGLKPESGAIVTGWDTFRAWGALLSSQQRFTDFQRVQMTVNGIQTAPGREAGVEVATYQGFPVVKDKNMVADTISRILGIDLTGAEIRVLSPVRHLSAPVSDAIVLDSFVEKHSLDMLAELAALKFASHFKLRDLK